MNLNLRLKAGLLHCLFSLILLAIALYLVFGLWYPHPLQEAMGVTHVYWLILSIDLIIGPLLTFIVFNPLKKELKIDLAVIVILQLTAFMYGLYTVEQGRPIWQVFVVDDIELVRPIDINFRQKSKFKSEYKSQFFSKPQWVSASYSKDTKIAQQQKEEEIFNNISLATRPESYQSFDSKASQINKKLKPVIELKKYNSLKDINKVIGKYNNKEIAGFLPVKGFEEDMIVLINFHMQPIDIVDLRPWG